MIESGLEQITATSARADKSKAIIRAEKAIGEYAQVMTGAFDDAIPLLHRALAATYTAVLELQDAPDRLTNYLDGKLPGPDSKNPIQPIVRKLWHRVPTRDALYRYAACLDLARRQNVSPNGFDKWFSARPGGIKAAAQEWSRLASNHDAKTRAKNTQIKKRDEILARFKPIRLPSAVALGRDPGLYLAAIRIVDGKARLAALLNADTKAVTSAVNRHGI